KAPRARMYSSLSRSSVTSRSWASAEAASCEASCRVRSTPGGGSVAIGFSLSGLRRSLRVLWTRLRFPVRHPHVLSGHHVENLKRVITPQDHESQLTLRVSRDVDHLGYRGIGFKRRVCVQCGSVLVRELQVAVIEVAGFLLGDIRQFLCLHFFSSIY